MAKSTRAMRLLGAMDLLVTTKPFTFDSSAVLKKLKLQSVSDGTMKASFTVETTMCNMGGSLHGGYIASVIDVLSFYTQLSTSDGRVSWTTSMNVNYIGAVYEGEKVNVETKAVKSGKSAVVETYFHDSKGSLVAKGTTSFLATSEKYQSFIKEFLNFDVYKN